MKLLTRLLEHPLTRGLDLDDPVMTYLRRRIIEQKPLLRSLYREWYETLAREIPEGSGRIVEIGAGGGFLDEFVLGAVRSEIFMIPGVDLAFDGQAMPFEADALKAIVMTNVFHHVTRPRAFLREAARVLRPGGVVAMLEPWTTLWSRFVYRRLHHEPFLPAVPDWDLPKGGPLSTSNQALAWIVFQRDRALFVREFPEFTVKSIRLTMPFRYLLSGGVATRNLMPGWTTPMWREFERLLAPVRNHLAMFAYVTLERAAE
ncbi:MAG: class I SAM-dependent methyltransferase [Thermoanaerobaculia bacterium]